LNALSPGQYTGKSLFEKELEDFVKSKIKQEDEKKYRCSVTKCGKLFMASEFVKKHLKLKHANLVEDIKAKVDEDQYFQNYLSDPRRILPSVPEPKPAPHLRPEQRFGERLRRSVPDKFYPPMQPEYIPIRGLPQPPGPPLPPISRPFVAFPPVRGGFHPYADRSPFGRGGFGRGGFGGGMRGRPPFNRPYRPGYVDLDAPPDDAALGEQRATIDYGDLDAVPEPPPSIATSQDTTTATMDAQSPTADLPATETATTTSTTSLVDDPQAIQAETGASSSTIQADDTV